MSSEVQPKPPDRPLLLLLSNLPDLPARVRSRTHDVHNWVAEDDAGEFEFTGDPAAEQTYEWTRAARDVTAVIDLAPIELARGALRALRRMRPDAAVLILSDEAADMDGDRDGTLARAGELRDVLRLDLDEELLRLEAERRSWCLRRFAEDDDVVPILMHPDPDPDAISSAFAAATLLGGSAAHTPIVTLDEMRRPENVRMAELLNIRVTRVTKDELLQFPRVIAVDMQPRGLQQEDRPRFAVIDHHPLDAGYHAEFLDVRPEYGATATMLVGYLRAAFTHDISAALASALLYGIKTDTDSLRRGVSPADVEAYAFLQEHADLALVRRFERPSFAPETARSYGRALADAVCVDDLCAAYLGDLAQEASHVLAELADFCLGIENITWVAVAAVVEGEVVVTLRHAGISGADAGAVARALARNGGSGGGHATMARVTLAGDTAQRLPCADEARMAQAVHELVRQTIDDVAQQG